MGVVKDILSLGGAGIKSIINRRREKRAARKARLASERVQEAQSVILSKLNLANKTPGLNIGGGKLDFVETAKLEPVGMKIFSFRNILIIVSAFLFGWFLLRKVK